MSLPVVLFSASVCPYLSFFVSGFSHCSFLPYLGLDSFFSVFIIASLSHSVSISFFMLLFNPFRAIFCYDDLCSWMLPRTDWQIVKPFTSLHGVNIPEEFSLYQDRSENFRSCMVHVCWKKCIGEDSGFLGCDSLSLGPNLAFEDGGSTFLRNVGNHEPSYIVSWSQQHRCENLESQNIKIVQRRAKYAHK
jgi:hypothetical protein